MPCQGRSGNFLPHALWAISMSRPTRNIHGRTSSHHFFWKEVIARIDSLIRLYQIYRYSTHYCVPFARVEADWHWGGLNCRKSHAVDEISGQRSQSPELISRTQTQILETSDHPLTDLAKPTEIAEYEGYITYIIRRRSSANDAASKVRPRMLGGRALTTNFR
jgi:hypothetical protein